MGKSAKVIPFNATKNQEMSIDFLEIDHIRETVKNIGKDFYNFRPNKYSKQFYARSTFYIGRGVTVLRFRDFSLAPGPDKCKMNGITRRLAEIYPEYKFYYTIDSITCYLRGANEKNR